MTMPPTDTATDDYTTGVPRHHHSLYLDDGNFVMQVENAIFKVHRSVLTKYSSVIEDMLNAPQGSNVGGGTDEEPLILIGDKVVGWELLLGWRYESSLFGSKPVLSNEQLLSILHVAHKYCMGELEENTLKELGRASTTADYVDVMIAAQIVGSDSLYQTALEHLITSDPILDLEQAGRIGLQATYAILTANISNKDEELAEKDIELGRRYRYCQGTTTASCIGCHRRQF